MDGLADSVDAQWQSLMAMIGTRAKRSRGPASEKIPMAANMGFGEIPMVFCPFRPILNLTRRCGYQLLRLIQTATGFAYMQPSAVGNPCRCFVMPCSVAGSTSSNKMLDPADTVPVRSTVDRLCHSLPAMLRNAMRQKFLRLLKGLCAR